jgi:anti-sigma factor RsiW
MTTHHDYISLIVRAADGSLDAARHGRLEEHLASCGECREALETQVAMRALVMTRPEQQASREFAARVRAQLPAGNRSWIDGWDFRVWTWRLAPVAAIVLVAAFAVARRAPVPIAPLASGATSISSAVVSADAPVSSALWSASVSDTSVLSLMIYAQADDSLAGHLKDKQ